jgi:YaiO family outer membrane protein
MKTPYLIALGSIVITLLASGGNWAQTSGGSSPNSTPVVQLDDKPRSELQFSTAYESLSNGYENWRTATLDFSHRFRSGHLFYGSLLATERFRQRDRQATIGFYQPVKKNWTLQFEASVSPNYRTLPKWSAFIGVERKLRKGWNISGGYRRTHYRSAKVNLVNSGVEKYFGNYRAAYTLYVSNLQSTGTSASHRFQFNRYYGEFVSSVGVTAAIGRELESLGSSGVLQTGVRSIGISGRHWFNRRWGMNYDAAFTKQGNFYNRRGASIGISFRF